jgi:UDP-glucose 4-epimerase
MTILVTGGAGYIGSQMVKMLRSRGLGVIVLDNLSTGHRESVPADVAFQQGDVADTPRVAALLSQHSVKAVIHFAASSLVGESMADPLKYYANNVGGTVGLVRGMREAGVNRLVFSSTAAVYGEPVRVPIDEDHPKQPVNPYGMSKLVIDRMLDELHAAHGFKSVSLRYFNAGGADPDGTLGERRQIETHLVPLVLQAASGRRPHIAVYGSDYSTRDGTCVRDYVHIVDLCDAHVRALDWLDGGGGRETINLGSEQGTTVLEVIAAARQATGREIPVKVAPRRAGDPASLIASCERARRVLGWRAQRSDIASIVGDAWRWEQRHAAA